MFLLFYEGLDGLVALLVALPEAFVQVVDSCQAAQHAVGVGLALGLLFTAFCRPLLRLFTQDPEVLDQAAAFVRAVLPLTWSFAVYNSIMSFSNGIGKVRYPMVVTILMLWAVRIPSAWLINRFWDGRMIIICHPLSFVFGMLAMLPFYLTKPWREIREKAREQQAGA